MSRRPSPALVVACLALIVALGGSALAAIPDPSGQVHFCYSPKTGDVKVVTVNQDDPECQRKWKDFDIEALPDSIQSQNGSFAVKATDNGIVMTGPGQSVKITAGGITVSSSSTVKVSGAMVQLNGSCAGVARRNDVVTGNPSPANNSIITSSSTVLAC